MSREELEQSTPHRCVRHREDRAANAAGDLLRSLVRRLARTLRAGEIADTICHSLNLGRRRHLIRFRHCDFEARHLVRGQGLLVARHELAPHCMADSAAWYSSLGIVSTWRSSRRQALSKAFGD